MRRMLPLILLLAACFLGVGPADAIVEAKFFRGTPDGCFARPPKQGWQPLTSASFLCQPGSAIKTDSHGWGTLEFPFGTLVVKANTQISLVPSGLMLESGSYKAFIRASTRGFKFRTPGSVLAVQGTIFSVAENGSVEVNSGAVEVTGNDGTTTSVQEGQTLGSSPVDTTAVDHAMRRLEEGLKAQHDRQWEQAANIFLELARDPGLANLPEFRNRISQHAVTSLARSSLSLNHPLVQEARRVLAKSAETFFSALEEAFKTGLNAAAQKILNLGSGIMPATDPRLPIAKALLADLRADEPGFNREVGALPADVGTAVAANPFWAGSLSYVTILKNPEQIPAEAVGTLLDPRYLETLTPKVARQRADLAQKLPQEILAARGLYLLIRAYCVDGDLEQARRLLAHMKVKFPGAWFDRAQRTVTMAGARVAVRSVMGAASLTRAGKSEAKTPKKPKDPTPVEAPSALQNAY
jgi:hypothetical protein